MRRKFLGGLQRVYIAILLIGCAGVALADEGMWLYNDPAREF